MNSNNNRTEVGHCAHCSKRSVVLKRVEFESMFTAGQSRQYRLCAMCNASVQRLGVLPTLRREPQAPTRVARYVGSTPRLPSVEAQEARLIRRGWRAPARRS
jgi:hypothetical protein